LIELWCACLWLLRSELTLTVQEQAGLFAGKGGFDVKVGEHTQLNGAVIGSTASREHNRLDTGTLGFSDIDNQAAYKVEHQSIGASTGGGLDNFIGNLANGLVVAGNKQKSDSSTTHAAVSDGTIVVNDSAKQQQNVDGLSRDVEHANQTLSPIFGKEKEQQRMQAVQLIGEIGNQAADIARTLGEIEGLKAAKAEHPTYSDKQLRETLEFQQASKPFGTGSDIQQAITASTAAIQGLAGGDIAKALAGGAGTAKITAVVSEKIISKVAAHTAMNAGKSAGLNFPIKILGEYFAIKLGPLSSDLAGTFSGGKYKEIILKQNAILYRKGVSDKPYGQFFSSEAPQGMLQTRVDKAVLPQWPGGETSPINSSIAIKIPPGTKGYVGEVGSQNGLYVGGTQQIIVPKAWAIKGAEIMEIKPLK